MPRPFRIEYEGAWYHVMNRGAGRRAVFGGTKARRLFLDLLGELDETFGVETHAYCLLGDDYHLLAHTPRGNLGRAMRHLGGLYTQRVNRLDGSDGPVFRGRYKAVVVDADAYLAAVGRYIHMTPVAAGLARRPEAWRWSSCRAYLGDAAPPPWLRMEATLALFGKRGARRRYRAFVAQGVEEELAAFYGAGRQAAVLGDERFRARITRGRARNRRAPVPRRAAAPGLAEILAATAAEFDTTPEWLLTPRRRRQPADPARTVAVGLGRVLGGLPLKELGTAFGIGHYAGVSSAVRRFKALTAGDPALARRVRRIRTALADYLES